MSSARTSKRQLLLKKLSITGCFSTRLMMRSVPMITDKTCLATGLLNATVMKRSVIKVYDFTVRIVTSLKFSFNICYLLNYTSHRINVQYSLLYRHTNAPFFVNKKSRPTEMVSLLIHQIVNCTSGMKPCYLSYSSNYSSFARFCKPLY